MGEQEPESAPRPRESLRLAEPPPAAAHEGKTRLGDYVLLDAIASGGSGVVYRAWQMSLQRFVAVKVVDRANAQGAEGERVIREARMAARLSHPHITPIYDVGEHDGRVYLAMKLIAGSSMDRIRVEPRRAILLICQAIDAIEYAHRNGVVHRDLKPHNLLLEGPDHVWVTDFGIARSTSSGSTLTATGKVLGTPAYMAPEQARGGRCDERSDVYSLGATLYELLTGRHPFYGTDDLLVLLTRVLSVDPVPPRRLNPEIPAEVETIVGKAMAKDPARRYPTARAFEDDLRRHLGGEPIEARPPGRARRAAKWTRRHPVTTSALVFVAALGLGAVFHTLSLKRQLAETTVAEANALGAADQWESARARYTQAARAFDRIGVSSVAPDLGLLDAYHHAPPPLMVMSGHRGSVRGVAFLPAGRQALSGGDDGMLRLWDVARGSEVRAFAGHHGAVTALAVAADGNHALSGGRDGTLRVWDLGTGGARAPLTVRGGAVQSLALSPDGTRALSRSTDGIVQLWDLERGRALRSFPVAVNRVVAVAFTPDGKLALTGRPIEQKDALVNMRASLWDVATGREVQSLGGFVSEIQSFAFSADGRLVLSAGYDRQASLWDLATGRRLLSLAGHLHRVTGATFSPRDRIIFSGAEDSTVKLWDADDGQLIRSFDTGDSVEALAVSPDGSFILTGGGDGALELWDASVGQEARAFGGHQGGALALDFSPDGRLAVSGGVDRRVRVWDVATGREVRSFDHAAGVHAVAFSPDGTTILSAGGDSYVEIWDLRTGRAVGRLEGHTGNVRGLAVSPGGNLALSASDRGEVRLWELPSGLLRHAWHEDGEVRSVTFSADGRLALWGSFDGAAALREVDSGAEVRALHTDPSQPIGAVALSRDGHIVATGDEKKTVRLWDASTGRLLDTLEGHRGDVRAVRFSPDGSLVLSASRDQSLRVWDTDTGRELHAFTWATHAIRSFALSRDGEFALAGSDDGSLYLWDFSYVRRHRAIEARLAAARDVLERRPEDAAALATLGEWYAFRGVPRWALEFLGRARAGGAAVSPLVLARAYWVAGDLAAARGELESALAQHEAPADYLSLLIDNIGSGAVSDRPAIAGPHEGRVRLPFLGIRTGGEGSPFEVGEQPEGGGALVTRVFARSPAQRAGLRIGDTIIRVDDQTIADDATLGSYVSSRVVGASVSLSYVRDGVTRVATATLTDQAGGKAPSEREIVHEPRSGYAFTTLSLDLAIGFGLDPATQGAVVTDIGHHPPAAIANSIAVDDVLVRVDGHPLATAEEAVVALSKLPLDHWKAIEIIRPGHVR